MAQITLTVDDTLVPRLKAAYIAYLRMDPASTNVQVLAAVKNDLRAQLVGIVTQYERAQAQATAEASRVDLVVT